METILIQSEDNEQLKTVKTTQKALKSQVEIHNETLFDIIVENVIKSVK